MADLPDLLTGLYRHYKGPLYLVLGYGHDANADTLGDTVEKDSFGNDWYVKPLEERNVVVYIGLQLDGAHKGPRLAIRTVEDFFAEVCTRPEHRHYGAVVVEEERVPCSAARRFTYVGPSWEG